MSELQRIERLDQLLGPLAKGLNMRIRTDLRVHDEPKLLGVYRAAYREQLLGKRLSMPIYLSRNYAVGDLVDDRMLDGVDDEKLVLIRVDGLSQDVHDKFLNDVRGVAKAMDARAEEMSWTVESLAVALGANEAGRMALFNMIMEVFPLGVQSAKLK